MVIGIDYRLAVSSHRGMGRYCREIVEKLFDLDHENQYILYVDRECDRVLPPNFRWHKLPAPANYIVGEQLYMPFLIRRDKLDVMWCTSNTFPLFIPRSVRLVVTVHDLIFMYKLPRGQNFTQRVGALYRRWVMRLGYGRIDKCVTVSQFSAAEIKRIFGLDNIAITYNCIESFYRKMRAYHPSKSPQGYYFTLSADAPSKNLPFLLDAFAHKLTDKRLIVGGVKDNSPLRELYPQPNIVFLADGVSDEELIEHYMSCEAFLYVSLQEGFGIPPLEALACGAKVVCSYETSLREVVDGCGILINPRSEQELLDAIERIGSFSVEQLKIDAHIARFIDWRESAVVIKDCLTIGR